MSKFITTGTLKQRTIPGATLELLQRAFNARSAAPDGTNISWTYNQGLATGNIQIPSRVGFFGGGQFQVLPKFIYSEEIKDRPLDNWLFDFVDFNGDTFSTSYSGGLIAMTMILNEAERRSGSDSNIGVTSLNFNDETQIFSAQLSLPININVRDSGEVYIQSVDYVSNIEFSDLLEIPLPPASEDSTGNSDL